MVDLGKIAKSFKKEGLVSFIPLPPKFLINVTCEVGKASGAYYGFVFSLPKWGFESFKAEEGLYVSPTFVQAYQLTIQQKNQIEQQIKAYAADLARAMSDVELLLHDLRKYKEFLEYFSEIEEGKSLLEKAEKEKNRKKKEELIKKGEEKIKKGEIALRSVFIDQIDIHTGVNSLVEMARARWPTIIADFMQLREETTKEEVKKKLPMITNAEAIVLAKKNILYLEWKKMFLENVKSRYQRIKQILGMRKASIEKYKEMLLPLIKKYESYKEWIPHPKAAWAKPASQAQLIETTTLWVWKAIPYEYEPYKPKMNLKKEKAKLEDAGYNKEEIKELKKLGIEETEKLPIEPSVDDVVRKGLKELEKEYKRKISIKYLEDVRKELINRIYNPEITQEQWRPSPFYAFFEVEMTRSIFRLPNGAQFEDLEITFKPTLISQNLMLIKLVEMKLIEENYEKEIQKFLGEAFKSEKNNLIVWKSLEEELKEEFPYIFGEKEEKEIEVKIKKKVPLILKLDEKIRKLSSKYLGIEIGLLHSYGPYSSTYAEEFFLDYVIDSSVLFKNTFFSMLGVPL